MANTKLKHNPVTSITKEIKNAHELISLFEGEVIDEETLMGLIEGETNLTELLLEIEEIIAERELAAIAIKERIAQLTKRKSRIENGTTTLRMMILSAMHKTGLKKIEGDLATITVKKVAPKLEVIDESLIPPKYFKKQDPVLDKKLLMADLKGLDEGEKIEGAGLSKEGISLQIRRD